MNSRLDEHLNLLLKDNVGKTQLSFIGRLIGIEELKRKKEKVKLKSKAIRNTNTQLNTIVNLLSADVSEADIQPLCSDLLFELTSNLTNQDYTTRKIENTWSLALESSAENQYLYYSSDEECFCQLVDNVFPRDRSVISIVLPHSQKTGTRDGTWEHLSFKSPIIYEQLNTLVWSTLLSCLRIEGKSKKYILEKVTTLPLCPRMEEYTPLISGIINISKDHEATSKTLGIESYANHYAYNDASHLYSSFNFLGRTFGKFSLLRPMKYQPEQGESTFEDDIKAYRQSLSYLLCQTSGHIITMNLDTGEKAKGSSSPSESCLITPYWWSETIKSLRPENNRKASQYVRPDLNLFSNEQYLRLSDVNELRTNIKQLTSSRASKRKKIFHQLLVKSFNKPGFPSLMYPYPTP